MRFRLGFVIGGATGYYLGAKAGRQRYEQINRTLHKVRRSETFEAAAERSKEVVELGVEKARNLADRDHISGDGMKVPDLPDTGLPGDPGVRP